MVSDFAQYLTKCTTRCSVKVRIKTDSKQFMMEDEAGQSKEQCQEGQDGDQAMPEVHILELNYTTDLTSTTHCKSIAEENFWLIRVFYL